MELNTIVSLEGTIDIPSLPLVFSNYQNQFRTRHSTSSTKWGGLQAKLLNGCFVLCVWETLHTSMIGSSDGLKGFVTKLPALPAYTLKLPSSRVMVALPSQTSPISRGPAHALRSCPIVCHRVEQAPRSQAVVRTSAKQALSMKAETK